jgi:hypothetical protein
MSQPAIACTLTDAELRERRGGLLATLRAAVLEERETDDGLALRLAPGGETLALAARVIDLERQCCRFLRFRLTVEPDEGPLWLELSGPEGTKPFVRSLLG